MWGGVVACWKRRGLVEDFQVHADCRGSERDTQRLVEAEAWIRQWKVRRGILDLLWNKISAM